MPETAGAAGDENRLARLCAQLFCDRLISGQPCQGDRCRRHKVEPFRHSRCRKRRNGHIFREGAETAARQAGIDPVSRLELGDMFARFLHDTSAFISKSQGHFVILYQPDGPGQVENIHRVDRRGLDPDQDLIIPDCRDRDIIDGNADSFAVLRDLCRFHEILSFLFPSECGADHPGTGVGSNSCADLVDRRRFIAQLLHHQAGQEWV